MAACEGNPIPPDLNASPRLAGPIPHQVVEDSVALDLTTHFVDPNGDALTFTATSSNTAAVRTHLVGAIVTLVAIVKGSATVTVTATDPDGATATYGFPATVPNRAPRVVISFPDIEAFAEDRVVTRVGGHFTDPDHDSLTFSAEISDAAVATVELAGDKLRVWANAPGMATIAVTATDTEGLATTQEFVLTVPNRAPRATEPLPGIEVEVGEEATLRVSGHFMDPDGEELTYAAGSSEAGVAGVVVSGDEVTVRAVAKGIATITVTATDPGGSVAVQDFPVTVPNRAPLAVDTLPDIEVEVGGEASATVSGYFADPDGDSLTFAGGSFDEAVATVSAIGDRLTVRAVAKGMSAITVTAEDPEGLTAVLAFEVRVPNRRPLVTGMLPDMSVEVGEAAGADLTEHFTEPDGDELVFAAESSDPSVATTSVSGNRMTVEAVAKGVATVTITAADSEGLAVEQGFLVTVPNRPPLGTHPIPDFELEVGEESATDLTEHFADPDGDTLHFAAESSDSTVAFVDVSGGRVTVGALARGTVTVMVTASDSAGLEVAQTFQVLVPKRGPVVKAVIPGQRVQVGELALVYLPDHFEHPDGDTLTFSVESTVPAVASADVAGNDLRIRAISRGISRVTVWATDSGGLAAGISFDVLVPNRPPVVRVRFGDRRLEAGEQVTLSLDNRFSDPDGDALTFATESSSPSVATATVVGDDVRVAAVTAGRATVTVTAYDPAGESAAQSFTVTVVETPANHNPQTVGTIPDADLDVGDQITIDVSGYFTDPDEDDLTFDASSSDASVAAAAISGDAVYVTGDAEGTATITVTATDPDGLSASQRFTVTVSDDSGNRAPRPNGTIPDQTLIDGDHLVFDVSGFFADPDGDDLYFSAASSNTSVTTASTSGVEAEIAAISPGTAGITITATDPSGLTATQSFGATVQERIVDNGLDITLHYHDDVASAYRPTIDAAMSLIKSVLADNEFWNFTVDSTYTCLEASFHLGTVDDVAIFVRSMAIDGSRGVLAQASVCLARQDTYYPIIGGVQFDRVDIQELHARGQLFDVAVHEFLHVMGIGVNFHALGLAAGDTDRHFTGSRAIAAFDAAGGEDYQGRKVPTDQHWSHWRESVLDAELMTPGIESSGEMPFSAITIQALADMGYVVDLSLADDYELPSAGPQPDFEDPGGVLDLSDDVHRGPIMIIDRLGNIVRVIPGR